MRVAPDSEVTIVWGDLVLDGSLDADFKLETLDGWEEQPDGREESIDRPGRHGRFDAEIYADGRRPMAAGVCVDAERRNELLEQLEAAAYLGARGDLTITVAGRTLSTPARVRRCKPVVGPLWSSGVFPWAIEWSCPDAFRYGETRTETTGLPLDAGGLRYPLYTNGAGTDVGFLDYGSYGTEGSVTITNDGTAETWPRFTIAGNAPAGFTITEMTTGRRLLFVGPVAAGSSLALDSATGSVILDGVVSRAGELTRREWTPIPPKGSLTFEFRAPAGSPTLTVESTDTSW